MPERSLVFSLSLPCADGAPLTLLSGENDSAPKVDAEQLLTEAQKLGTLPAVFQNLRGQRMTATLPEESAWVDRCRRIHARNLALEQEGERIVEVLRQSGVEGQVIKGVPLTKLLYPDLSWREIGDVDLLVRPGDVARAYQCLKRTGLRDMENPWNEQAVKRAVRQPSYAFPQIKLLTQRGLLVELHWDWIENALPEKGVTGDREGLLVYLCRHAGKHFWCSLHWCCDIELYLQKFGDEVNWPRFWRLAREAGAARSCAASLHLCRVLFGRKLSLEQTAAAQRAARMLSRHAADDLLNGPAGGWKDAPVVKLMRVYNWKQRVFRLWGWLAPTPRHWTGAEGIRRSWWQVWLGRYLRIAFAVAAKPLPQGVWKQHLQKAAGLSIWDWAWLLRSFLTLAGVWVALRLISFDNLAAWVSKVKPRDRGEVSEQCVRRLSWLVDVAGKHHIVKMSCLPRSMALVRLLGRMGVESELKLGVRQREGKIGGHAWVEWRGHAIREPEGDEEPYRELPFTKIAEPVFKAGREGPTSSRAV